MMRFVLRSFRRRRWPAIEGRVIDKRHLKDFIAKFEATSKSVSVDEYLVEFDGLGGARKRVAIKEQSVHLPPLGLPIGQTVPIHANRSGTKAVFGRFEPVVSHAEQRRRRNERKARDRARFRKQLEES